MPTREKPGDAVALPLLHNCGMHVVLLGDSIFDNGAYTAGEPDVVTHLRSMLPPGDRATLLAVDGATVSAMAAQVRRVPSDATHLVVSVGGNDALRSYDLLSLQVKSSAQALQVFAGRIAAFEREYRAAIEDVVRQRRPVIICTIYNGALEPAVAAIARLGVALFNDVILRTAVDRRIDAIELRSICCEPSDYANPIEPSGRGGRNIAAAIVRALGAGDHRDRFAQLIGA